MVAKHLRIVLRLVLSIFFAFEAGAQFHNQSENELWLSKDMVQHGGVQERYYLNVVIELSKDGSFKVVKATRIFGEVILRDFQTSDFIYEATSGEMTLAVAFLPEDPFLVRALGESESAKESTTQANSATIVVNLPLEHGSLAEIRKLHLKIFKLLPGTNVDKINPSVFAELKAQKRLVLISDLPSKTFGRLISKKLITVRN
jgi:hypothetical protein